MLVASRSVFRETPSWAAIGPSRTRVPGTRRPAMMSSRNTVATCSAVLSSRSSSGGSPLAGSEDIRALSVGAARNRLVLDVLRELVPAFAFPDSRPQLPAPRLGRRLEVFEQGGEPRPGELEALTGLRVGLPGEADGDVPGSAGHRRDRAPPSPVVGAHVDEAPAVDTRIVV